jgi:hypothetical protein
MVYTRPRPSRLQRGTVLPGVPQSEEDLDFGLKDLADGCRSGVDEELSVRYAESLRKGGLMISSTFTVWQDSAEGRKGRFVVNLSQQLKHWPKRSIRMESLTSFGLDLRQGDHMISFDIQSGYRHFRMAPSMRNFFLFHPSGRHCRCLALPFGWGRSPLWFTQIMKPVVRALRNKGWRMLVYLDDFLVVPSLAGKLARPRHCKRAKAWISRLLDRLGVARHPTKGEWTGATRVEHLGFIVDSIEMRFYLAPRKIQKVKALPQVLKNQVALGRRWVDAAKLGSFLGLCVSLTLAFPFSRFYSRSLYNDLSRGQTRDKRASRGGACVRLSHQSVRDLDCWRRLAGYEGTGRPILPLSSDGDLHTDAADVGYGGTLDTDGEPGQDGQWQEQGIWSWRDRAESISVRELRAVRVLLQGSIGERSRAEGMHVMRLCLDNTSCVHVTRAFVSASTPMMRELRRLKRVLDENGLVLQPKWLPSCYTRSTPSYKLLSKYNLLLTQRLTSYPLVLGVLYCGSSSFARVTNEPPLGVLWLLCVAGPSFARSTAQLSCPPPSLHYGVIIIANMSENNGLGGFRLNVVGDGAPAVLGAIWKIYNQCSKRPGSPFSNGPAEFW